MENFYRTTERRKVFQGFSRNFFSQGFFEPRFEITKFGQIPKKIFLFPIKITGSFCVCEHEKNLSQNTSQRISSSDFQKEDTQKFD